LDTDESTCIRNATWYVSVDQEFLYRQGRLKVNVSYVVEQSIVQWNIVYEY